MPDYLEQNFFAQRKMSYIYYILVLSQKTIMNQFYQQPCFIDRAHIIKQLLLHIAQLSLKIKNS